MEKTDLLVKFEPGNVAFTVGILQAKEPHLSQAHRLYNLRINLNEIWSLKKNKLLLIYP